MINALTVDLEDYYHVSAFESFISKRDWDVLPSRIVQNSERVLELLDSRGVRATFFVLGWVADRYPRLVRRIAQSGHDIACHSFWHRLVYDMTPAEFFEDTRRAKVAIEDATGIEVVGYRAPSYSITPPCAWALEILMELGFGYDSSIFPVKHDRYGWPGQNRFACPIRKMGSATLWEFPPSTYPVFRQAVPVAGGGYLRILPYHYTKWALEHINEEEGHAGCAYFHPWEIDPEQPRLAKSTTAWRRHSFGLATMEDKLRRLLADFEFAPMIEVLGLRGDFKGAGLCVRQLTTDKYSGE